LLTRRKGLVNEAKRILERYAQLDPQRVGIALRRRLLEFLAKKGPSELLNVYNEITEIAGLFPHNSIVSTALVIAETLLDSGVYESVEHKQFSLAIRRIWEVLERTDKEYVERSTRALTLELYPDVDIFASTGGEIIYNSILGSRSKIEIVRAPFLSPYGKGRDLVELLDEEGVPAIWIPDYLRSIAIEKSDFLFFPVYAVTKEGFLVSDYGVVPSLELALRYGKQLLALQSWTSFTAVAEKDSLRYVPWINGIRLYDIIDPDEFNIRLVTDKFVIDSDRDTIVNLAESEIRGVKELVRASIRSVMG
jgi:hypothetical protein